MATNKNYEVIGQMFSAVLSANESEATIKALRPQVEEAVQALIEERGLPKNYTGLLPYHGFKIVVRRPKSYTWEKNTQIQGADIDFYKQLHGYYEQLQDNAPKALMPQTMSYADYYARYGTTEEADGWKRANPTGNKVIYVKN